MIGVFDSGFGGLTVFREIEAALPQYDYVYLGDNARVPYGTRSFETVYRFTKECVFKLFGMGCNLVILACNTASAKALRTIQQKDLPEGKKVLGVIRPTTERIDRFTASGKVGILATEGTVRSQSYAIEINKFHPRIEVYQHACPLWVPLVENSELDTPATAYIVEKDTKALLAQHPKIDSIVLACTHYPLLMPVIRKFVPETVNVLPQGKLVAESLRSYLGRHPEVESVCSKSGSVRFFTTDDPRDFSQKAEAYLGRKVAAERVRV